MTEEDIQRLRFLNISKTLQLAFSGSSFSNVNFFRPVLLNGWVFIYELSGCGFEFSCSHLFSFSVVLDKSRSFLNKDVFEKQGPNTHLQFTYELNWTYITQLAFTCSKLIIETLEQGWNIFKVTNKDTRTMLLALLWCIYY